MLNASNSKTILIYFAKEILVIIKHPLLVALLTIEIRFKLSIT